MKDNTFYIVPYDFGNNVFPPLKTISDLKKALIKYSKEESNDLLRGNAPDEITSFFNHISDKSITVTEDIKNMKTDELVNYISSKRITLSWKPFNQLREEDFADDDNPLFVQNIEELLYNIANN